MPGQFSILRISGLNHDMAFFSILMVFGFILEKSTIWRLIYCLVSGLALSRSGVLTLIAIVLFNMILKRNFLIKFKELKKKAFIFLTAVLIGIVTCKNVEIVKNTMYRLIMRFATLATGMDGSSVHMGYFNRAFEAIVDGLPVMQSLFGVGVNISGVALDYVDINATNYKFYESVGGLLWAVESDLAGIILGAGIIGFLFYYGYLFYVYLRQKNYRFKELVFAIIIFGIMYNIATSTLVQLVFIIMSADIGCHNHCLVDVERNKESELFKNMCNIS